MTATGTTDAGLERLLWHVEVGGSTHRLDVLPAAVGSSVAIEIDGLPRGRLPKPTPQHPWREASFEVDGEVLLIALAWHVPVMQTDVYVNERSVRDGRPLDVVRVEAPTALSNYEVWIGGVFRSASTVWRPPLALKAVVVASACLWLIVLALQPFPAELRLPIGAALGVSGVVLILSFAWSMSAVGFRVYRALLARPSLGDWRVALWFLAFLAYPLVVFVLVGLVVALLVR